MKTSLRDLGSTQREIARNGLTIRSIQTLPVTLLLIITLTYGDTCGQIFFLTLKHIIVLNIATCLFSSIVYNLAWINTRVMLTF